MHAAPGVWLVNGRVHPSFRLVSQMSGDGGAFFCSAVTVCKYSWWLGNTHTHSHPHTQNYSSMINSYHLLLSSIDLANRGLHWLRSPADYNQKDAQSEVFFKPEDTEDRCWAVKFLHLNLSRCHPSNLRSHSMYCANTSCLSVSSFYRHYKTLSIWEGTGIIRAIWFSINHSFWWWMFLIAAL